jgi:DNA-binding NarL/FixJ family response regulator
MIKVAVFDDNKPRRELLEMLLNSTENMQCTGAFEDCRDVVKNIVQNVPDVVLMDIDMPYVNGIEGLQLIKNQFPQVRIPMQTVFEDDDRVFDSICAGASGYILKRYATEEIPSAIRMVLTGGAPMTGSIARKVLMMVPQAKTSEQEKSNLTEKEIAILQYLVNGYSYKMIAAELKLSIDTVRFHIKKIYDKLHVHSATEAVSKAIKDKLI